MNLLKKYLNLLQAFRISLLLSILFQVLTSIFTVISIPVIIPFLHILFDPNTENQNFTPSSGKFLNAIREVQIWLGQYEPHRALFYLCAIVLVLFFLKNLFRYMALFYMIPVRNGLVFELRKRVYGKMMNLPYHYFKLHPRGDIIARASVDIQEVEWSILKTIEALFKSPLVILGSIILMISIDSKLSLTVLGLLIFIVLFMGNISRSLKKKSTEAQNEMGSMISWIEESLSGMKILHTFSKLTSAAGRFEKMNKKLKSLNDQVLRKRDLSSPLSEFLGISVVVFLMWMGSGRVFNNEMPPELFFAFLFAFYHVIEPAKSFATAYYSLQKGAASLERIEDFLNLEEDESGEEGIKECSFDRQIRLLDVKFHYPRENRPVLNGIALAIDKGQIIALTGPSGAGKSTVFDILLRLYDDYSGKVLIDGTDIRSIQKTSLRKIFSYISQEPFLFRDTIGNNIIFGADFYDEEKMILASKKANVDEFVNLFEKGFDTIIGERGLTLSGGERQRIALARAFYREAPVFLFDEPTSSIDAHSEMMIHRALHSELEDKTAIIIAHRMKTIQIADRVLFMKNGGIIEDGTHKELMEMSGEYQRFVELQSI